MKNSNKKRGFTIVELIIVIAVIAILAAVLIPTFSSLINKSLVAADESLVRNLNEALAMDVTNPHNTMTDALKATKENGFDVSKINARASTDGQKHEILWDSRNDCFVYEKGGEINYIPKSNTKGDATDVELWHIANDGTLSNKYSNYLAAGTYAAPLDITTGLDVGEHKEVTKVNYTNTNGKQDVVIRTNGGTLTVNAPEDTIWHYGNLAVADIQAVDDACYYEHGIVGTLSIKSGAAIIDNGGVVAKVAVVGDTDSNTKRATLSKQNGGLIYEVPASVTVADGEAATADQICAPSTDEEKSKYGYIVASAEDLDNLRTMVGNGTYNPTIHIVIVSDIVVSSNWTPIGNTSETAFSGTIIGNNHKISGLTDSLIKYARGNLSVSDLTLNVNIEKDTESFVGGLLGVYDLKDKSGISAKGLIDSVVVNGNISVSDKAGGIVGSTYNDNSGSNNTIDFVLRNCVNNATVSAKRAGGMIGTTAGYFAKDKANQYTGTTFRVSFENCTNDAVITSSQNTGNYRAGGFIGYCGGSGNYVFTSVTNKQTDALIGISRIGGTPTSMTGGGKDTIGNNAEAVVMSDYDYYQGRTTETIICTLWKWHDTLEQTQGSLEFSYKISEDKLSDNEWRFTFDNKHYKFESNAVGIRGIEDGVEQTLHKTISSDPNAYVVSGITIEYISNQQMNISGTIETWSGWMAKIGEGTFKFNPTDYIPHSVRNNYTITDNQDGTWTVAEK